jgi:hypothetical protein
MPAFAQATITPANSAGTSNTAPHTVVVLINPTEVSIQRGVTYTDMPVPGLQMPLLQFVKGEPDVLTCELFLDGTDNRDHTALGDALSVAERLNALRYYVTVDSSLHAPPVCTFSWGATSHITGVVTSMQERFTLFDEQGNILRARVTISIKSFAPVDQQARKINPQSPDRYKTHVVQEGDRLELIAADEYGDPSLWRTIASFNAIARPRLLVPGMVLQIPPIQ